MSDTKSFGFEKQSDSSDAADSDDSSFGAVSDEKSKSNEDDEMSSSKNESLKPFATDEIGIQPRNVSMP